MLAHGGKLFTDRSHRLLSAAARQGISVNITH
jgi:hypothetical protein